MPNRLAGEQSPYLLQHAQNPVDWYPWGSEARARARDEDRPMLISIGYSACHWCHVMERESFEDPEVARLMNEQFVNVKVDREERPDVDAIYMEAVQAMNGQGGWPLNVFVTPEGEPFFGGTYFPPVPHRSMPSWSQVLQAVGQAYRERRAEVQRTGAALTQAIREAQSMQASPEELDASILDRSLQVSLRALDTINGGFGEAPKFPQPLSLEFLLRMYRRFSSQAVLEAVELTLERMSIGGIHDQLGGGFHRYAVDAEWVVPHFEKMLYDNALLLPVYLHAYQITHKPEYLSVVDGIGRHLLRDMQSPLGGFYSSIDADSEGVEGKFYVWTKQEIESALSTEDAAIAISAFGITDRGNFEGATILTPAHDTEGIAAVTGIPADEVPDRLESIRNLLLELRSRRAPPGTDTKILASWNGLAIAGLAEAGKALGRNDFLASAIKACDFIFQDMVVDGQLVRSFNAAPSTTPAFLEDYAYLLEAVITLYETVWDERYLVKAQGLADEMAKRFWSDDTGAFYDTPETQDDLVVRPRNFFDNPVPSGNSAASFGLLRLASITGEARYERWAVPGLTVMRNAYDRAPLGFGHALSALDFYLSTPLQVGLMGGTRDQIEEMAGVVLGQYLPNRVLAVATEPTRTASMSPLLQGRRPIGERATAFVCEHFTCSLPVDDPDVLNGQLQARSS